MSAPASSGPLPEARLWATGFDQPWRVWQWGTPAAERPVIVALHGFTGCGLDWELPVATFGDAVGAWLAPDLPGHGGSVGFSGDEAYSLDGMREGLSRLIARLPVRPCLMGYSMGGRLAWHFAQQHSDLIEKLILIGARPGIEDPQARRERLRADHARAYQLENNSFASFIQEWERLPLLRSQNRIPEPWKSRLRERRKQQDPCELAQSLRLAGSGTMEPKAQEGKHLSCPVLWTVGTEDEPFKTIASTMVAMNPRFTTMEIPGAGHSAHLENSLVFYKSVWANAF